MSWRRYWESDAPVYVSRRHKLAHYRGIAEDIAGLIRHPDARVLDYGSGEALFAGEIAKRCGKLYLLDGAERVRKGLAARIGALPEATARRIAVLAPEEIDSVADRSLDLVLINSLVQYLSAYERDRVLAAVRRKLKPSGELVIADVIPREAGAASDAKALIGFAAREGFLTAALGGLVRTYFSDYRKTRAELGLARYDAAEMIEILAQAGFRGWRAGRNIGHNPGRLAFVARIDAEAEGKRAKLGRAA